MTRRNARGQFVSAATYRRSLAARHAWAERKAQARRRSEAARKGWETRRQTFKLKRQRDKKGKRRGGVTLPPKPKQTEFVLAVKYKSKRGRQHHGTVQASIFAPPSTSKAELKKAVLNALTGRATEHPVRIIEWKSRRSDR